jgi:hypothetical protein
MARKGRELYARVGLAQIPHILGMVDKHRLSPTYGCFDRSYWHYRTASFPSGMYQEFVLPLALVFKFPFPGGEGFYLQPRLKELVLAGMRFAARSSHRNGSCDDYFPYERALGAAAFSLYAMTESYRLLELQEEDVVEFFVKRGGWLMEHQESGRLSNHQALAALALQNVFLITGQDRFHEGARDRVNTLLGWQSQEGWFPEYQGCDPGYLTATIDFLAKYTRLSGSRELEEPLGRALEFLSLLVHPDGTCGGEYGSRNTYLLFPHGLELSARFSKAAAQMADLYLKALEEGRRVYLEDDRMCAHLSYDHLQAYLDFTEEIPQKDEVESKNPQGFNKYFSEAKLFLYKDSNRHLVVSAAKGGALSYHLDGKLAYCDSGLAAKLSSGEVLVTHLVDDYEVRILERGIRVGGQFGVASFKTPTPLTQVLFFVGMLLVGRWGSDLVRRLLQRLLIVGKRRHPMRFSRTVQLGEELVLTDEIWIGKPMGAERILELWAGTDHTSIYVAMSRMYRPGCLLPWTDYRELIPVLERDGYARLERHFS